MDARTEWNSSGVSLKENDPPARVQVRKIGVFRRIIFSLGLSRQQQIERDIVRLIASSDGRLTDEVERKIDRYLTRGSGLGYWQ
jgi:hypothetical protein